MTDDETREDLFFHSSQLAQPVKQRDRVTFEKEKTARGFSAVRINKVSK
ncbi:cold-shock protein [Siphonobacter sp.]